MTAASAVARGSFLPNLAVALDYGVQGNEYRFNRDADFALWHGLRVSCPDGRRGTTISTSPADKSAADQTRMHPPGTVFRRVITCPPPRDYEFALADGLEKRLGPWMRRTFLTYEPKHGRASASTAWSSRAATSTSPTTSSSASAKPPLAWFTSRHSC